jgi:membrane fusion protein, multidrug efflux system
MNRLLLILTISAVIVSCSSNNEDTSNADKINTYKKQIEDLNLKIEVIENNTDDAEYAGLRIPVKVEEVSYQPFSHSFTAAGELESIAEAYISPEVNGQIISINVSEGEYVKKGQLLALLNTVVIDKNIIEIKSELNLAKIIYDKQSQLWGKEIGSERQYLEAKNSFEGLENKLQTLNAQKEMAVITSPIDGVVEEINQKMGELASPGAQLMQIVNIDELYVSVQLSEAYLSVIKKGDIVDITFPSYPGMVYREPVYRTGNVINPKNRTFIVQVRISNKKEMLKPHMLANIRINDYNAESAIVLPSIIIKEDMTGPFIFIIGNENGNKIATKKYVKTGKSFKDKTEVVEGINVGDIIITDGYNNISKGSVVNVVN